ncbi:phage gp6-like head-tail connector protein [Sphingomonas ginsenosidivorax]|uniref:Phage gp6-like head-tail connector protein n=1 Tax=Sphingomonas ginsenosidivorax TaxID=862135 RepID=A0A5C6UI77_9SPHN|nr:head-tail connector protein [Sphingomonas ginsenosidivorax]TXC72160.1 phage gp6-like head-tail connector protein [Sphingomonas ginsenosidivorax]
MSGAIPPGVIADAVAAAMLWLRLESDEGVLAGLAETAILTAEAFLGTIIVPRDESAGWDAVPAPIALGVAMLVAHLFEARGGDAAPPEGVAALWRPYRQVRL